MSDRQVIATIALSFACLMGGIVTAIVTGDQKFIADGLLLSIVIAVVGRFLA